jgi:hypothetical protein
VSHECIDDQDNNDSTENDQPIGNLSARSSCGAALSAPLCNHQTLPGTEVEPYAVSSRIWARPASSLQFFAFQ